ncbi:hypothetical protein Dimus_029475 [Dionaea muscipula]
MCGSGSLLHLASKELADFLADKSPPEAVVGCPSDVTLCGPNVLMAGCGVGACSPMVWLWATEMDDDWFSLFPLISSSNPGLLSQGL